MRITHPFHPYSGQQFPCVGKRYSRNGKRILLQIDERTVCAVPLQWTHLAPPDVEIVLGEGRAAFRIADLLELARLVERLTSGRWREKPDEV